MLGLVRELGSLDIRVWLCWLGLVMGFSLETWFMRCDGQYLVAWVDADVSNMEQRVGAVGA